MGSNSVLYANFKARKAVSKLFVSSSPVPAWWWFSDAGKRCIQHVYYINGLMTRLVKVQAFSLRSEFGRPIYLLIYCNRFACTDKIAYSENNVIHTGLLGWSQYICTSLIGVCGISYSSSVSKIMSWSYTPKRESLILKKKPRYNTHINLWVIVPKQEWQKIVFCQMACQSLPLPLVLMSAHCQYQLKCQCNRTEQGPSVRDWQYKVPPI